MLKKFFTDKSGRVVVFQRPNILIVAWAVATVLSKLSDSLLALIASTVAFGSLVVWAILEIRSGASPFRRLLGVVVLTLSIYSRMQS